MRMWNARFSKKRLLAFSFVELLVVLVIVFGILSIGIPMYKRTLQRTEKQSFCAEVYALASALENWRSKNETIYYPDVDTINNDILGDKQYYPARPMNIFTDTPLYVTDKQMLNPPKGYVYYELKDGNLGYLIVTNPDCGIINVGVASKKQSLTNVTASLIIPDYVYRNEDIHGSYYVYTSAGTIIDSYVIIQDKTYKTTPFVHIFPVSSTPNMFYTATLFAQNNYGDYILLNKSIFLANRNPILNDIGNIVTYRYKPVTINLVAYDPDTDDLSYEFVVNNNTYKTQTVTLVFDTLGVYPYIAKATDPYNGVSIATGVISVINSTPVILNVNTPSVVYLNNSATFSVTATDYDNDPLTYRWIINNNLYNSDTAVITFTSTGIYTATVYVCDPYVCTPPLVYPILVKQLGVSNNPPTATILVNLDVAYSGDTFIFTASATDIDGDPLTYLWIITHNKESKQYTTTVVNRSFIAFSCYDEIFVELTVYDQKDQAYVTRMVYLQNKTPTIVSVNVPNVATKGSVISLSANAEDYESSEGSLTYTWFVDGKTFSGKTITFNAPDDKSSVSWNVTVSDGCSSTSKSGSIVLNNPSNNSPSVSLSCPTGTVGKGTYNIVANMSDSDNDTLTYTFVVDLKASYSGNTSGSVSETKNVKQQSISIGAKQIGRYTFSVQVSDGKGGTSSDSCSFNVTNLPPILSVIPDKTTVFSGNSVYFDVDGSDPDGDLPLTCQHNISDGNPTTISDNCSDFSWTAPNVTATTNISWNSAIQDAVGLPGNAQSGIIKVIPTISSTITSTYDFAVTLVVSSTNVSKNTPVDITCVISDNNPTSTIFDLQISYGEGTQDIIKDTTSKNFSKQVTYTSTGLKKIECIAYNKFGKSDSKSVYVLVQDFLPSVSVSCSPKTVTVNNSVECIATITDRDTCNVDYTWSVSPNQYLSNSLVQGRAGLLWSSAKNAYTGTVGFVLKPSTIANFTVSINVDDDGPGGHPGVSGSDTFSSVGSQAPPTATIEVVKQQVRSSTESFGLSVKIMDPDSSNLTYKCSGVNDFANKSIADGNVSVTPGQWKTVFTLGTPQELAGLLNISVEKTRGWTTVYCTIKDESGNSIDVSKAIGYAEQNTINNQVVVAIFDPEAVTIPQNQKLRITFSDPNGDQFYYTLKIDGITIKSGQQQGFVCTPPATKNESRTCTSYNYIYGDVVVEIDLSQYSLGVHTISWQAYDWHCDYPYDSVTLNDVCPSGTKNFKTKTITIIQPLYNVACVVTPDNAGSCSPSSQTASSGQSVSFTVTPNFGFIIKSISGVSSCNGALKSCSFTVSNITSNTTVTVVAEATDTYRVACEGCTANPDVLLYNQTTQINITLPENKKVESIQVNGATISNNCVGAVGNCSFSLKVTNNLTVKVTSTYNTTFYRASINCDSNLNCSISPENFASGSKIDVSISAKSGYLINDYSITGGSFEYGVADCSGRPSCSFGYIPSSDVHLNASSTIQGSGTTCSPETTTQRYYGCSATGYVLYYKEVYVDCQNGNSTWREVRSTTIFSLGEACCYSPKQVDVTSFGECENSQWCKRVATECEYYGGNSGYRFGERDYCEACKPIEEITCAKCTYGPAQAIDACSYPKCYITYQQTLSASCPSSCGWEKTITTTRACEASASTTTEGSCDQNTCKAAVTIKTEYCNGTTSYDYTTKTCTYKFDETLAEPRNTGVCLNGQYVWTATVLNLECRTGDNKAQWYETTQTRNVQCPSNCKCSNSFD